MIDRVKSFYWLRPKYWFGTEESREKHIKKMTETRHPCSCDACCNPRRSAYHKGTEKMTIQERRALRLEDEDVQL